MRNPLPRPRARIPAGAILAAALLCTTAAVTAHAGGAICGQVSDPQGAPLPAARVDVSGDAGTAATTSGHDGAYCLDVPPGSYRLRASAAGYRAQEFDDLHVPEAGTAAVDVTLGVGEAEEVW